MVTLFQKIKGKKPHMLLKVDLEKAFDKLEWSFIHDTLMYFKFPPKSIKMIMACITTSEVAVLVNETRIEFFSPTKGIRQGDPILPYIFTMYENALKENRASCSNQRMGPNKNLLKGTNYIPPVLHR